MWQWFQNIFSSFSSYADLSPDVKIQRQVRRWLSDRPPLSVDEWFTRFWEPRGISRPLVEFISLHMGGCAGLDFTRVQPDDRLIADLQLPLICWFDWEITFGDQFLQQFGVDVGDRLDFAHLHTLQDFIFFLQRQIDDHTPASLEPVERFRDPA